MDNPHTSDPYNLAQIAIEMWPIDKVRPYPKNNKVHSPDHIRKLKASIAADGLFDALIVDVDGVIIAGHGRFEALVGLGHVQVPVRCAKALTKNQADAARIAHNKTASNEYDSGFLAEELARLANADDVDLFSLGLDERELEFLTEDLGEIDTSGLAEDLDAEIDAQDAASKAKVAEVDAGTTALAKIIGFNAVPTRHAPVVKRFIAEIEAETGAKGADAFVEWLNARAA